MPFDRFWHLQGDKRLVQTERKNKTSKNAPQTLKNIDTRIVYNNLENF